MKQNGQNVVKIAKPPNTSEMIRNASDTYNGKRTSRLRVWVSANWTRWTSRGFQGIIQSFPKKLEYDISLNFTAPIRPKSSNVFVQSDE